MKITKAEFITSVADKNSILNTDKCEFAFVGRSNAGKSSMINNLVGKKGLAKTSALPGLTKLVNYFLINDEFYFVDLPGYGYAKTSKIHQGVWSNLIGEYLLLSENLKMVFLLLDIRREPNELDKVMLNFLIENEIPFSIIATKADKLSTQSQKLSVEQISKDLGVRKEIIFVHSSKNSFGKENILTFIEGVISQN